MRIQKLAKRGARRGWKRTYELRVEIEDRRNAPRRTCRQEKGVEERITNVGALDAEHEFVDLLLGLFTRIAVTLLQSPDELIATPFHHVEIIISELSPLHLCAPFKLSPLSLYLIPIHKTLS